MALSVVEDLDVFEQVEPCRGAGGEAQRAADPADLAFERRPEGLHRGVVVAVTGGAEADLEAGQGRGGAEIKRRVSSPAVGVVISPLGSGVQRQSAIVSASTTSSASG